MTLGARCQHSDAADCLADIAVKLGVRPREQFPHKYVGDCPVCGHHDKLSAEPGTGDWIVWWCNRRKRGQAGWCDPAEIRGKILESVSADHLGGYARFRSDVKPRLSRDDQLAQALRKLSRIERLLRTEGMPPADLRVRIGAELWNDGTEPDDRGGWLALAEESGVGRSQRYEGWARRMGGRLRRQ